MEKAILRTFDENGHKDAEIDITDTPPSQIKEMVEYQDMINRRWEIKRIEASS